jgi:thioredoxin-like negative regulator of GroEL
MEILRFTAEWCGPCKMLAKSIEELKPDVKITVVDIDEHIVKAQKYSIRSVPTMVAIHEGMEIGRKSGTMSVNQLKEWIESLK